MRILVPLHDFAPGGVERVALRLCRAWAADGVDVQLVIGHDDGALRDEAPPYASLGMTRRNHVALALRLRASIRREKPDAIFCAGNTYAFVAVLLKLILGRACPPIVAKVSNDLGRADMRPAARWFYRRWLRVQGRFIDRFVGMAEPMRAEIADAMRVPPERIAIVDDPSLSLADIAGLATPANAPERHRFLAIGRLAPQKNFALLVAAFATIARAGDTLTILGEGPLRGALERQVAAFGLGDRVRLPGHGDAFAQFAAADIFVLSSDYEGVPAVLAEALAAGLPIVATNCSVSIADMLGGHGTIVPVRDASALARAMDLARDTQVDRATMRDAAARFTVERAAKLYRELLETVTRASRD